MLIPEGALGRAGLLPFIFHDKMVPFWYYPLTDAQA